LPIYLIYRVLSGISTHPTLNILESYLTPGGFIRVSPAPVNGSIADSARITALYATAFLACAVLGDHGSEGCGLRLDLCSAPSQRSLDGLRHIVWFR